ncbi:decarboxylase [Polaromonas sp. A23]|nr:decarboxylase [Polaromonas sp. A23]
MSGQPTAPLTPVLDPKIARLVYACPAILAEMVEQYGSPLHVVWPHSLVRNVLAFRAVLNAHGLRHLIFYGAKVNKSQALVRAAVEAGVGVDVSSIHEWRDALHAGADPAHLCATGPAKTRAFHAELVASYGLISIDSVEELHGLMACMGQNESSRRARVLLRYRPALSQASRFGMGSDDLLRCMGQLSQESARLAFEGFHFHLGGYALETRAQALRELIPYVEAARAMGLTPGIIDIGGGMPIQYVDSDGYEIFLRGQNSSHYRNARVPEAFYPYGGRLDAFEWLNRLLDSPCRGDLSIAQYLRKEDIALAIEPGRSLADQAAISVFRVTRVKRLAGGHHVIFVEGSSFSACETWFASEFLQDPILVSATATREVCGVPLSFHAYIAGHSCLDDDVLTNRLISFNRPPCAGDLLVYANTGGYQMDLLENEFHRHPMPRRIAVHCNATGGFDVSPDDPREQLDDIEQSD